MKVLIRQTSWSYDAPNVIRVELEIPVTPDGSGIKVFAGNHVHIYGESRWSRLLIRLKGVWRK